MENSNANLLERGIFQFESFAELGTGSKVLLFEGVRTVATGVFRKSQPDFYPYPQKAIPSVFCLTYFEHLGSILHKVFQIVLLYVVGGSGTLVIPYRKIVKL